jgi:hypothetical protein
MASSHSLRAVLPAVILVALAATGLGASYYFASASTVDVRWAVNPLRITFSAQTGSGSAPDSFKCSPSVAPVTLKAFPNQPDIITLTIDKSAFPSCGSLPDNVVVTTACTPAAQANGSCLGDFSGMVVVCGPEPYTCLSEKLSVNIRVHR